jgi:hypothetical protein
MLPATATADNIICVNLTLAENLGMRWKLHACPALLQDLAQAGKKSNTTCASCGLLTQQHAADRKHLKCAQHMHDASCASLLPVPSLWTAMVYQAQRHRV